MFSRELGNKEFNSNDTRGPKSVSTFLVRLSELAPRLILKQMTLLANQLDSEVRRNDTLCDHGFVLANISSGLCPS